MRRFLCLVLVACFIFSIFALPAQASSIAVGTVAISGLAASAAVLAGIGLTIESLENFGFWDNIVSGINTFLSSQGFLDSNGRLSILSSNGKSYLPLSLISSVKDIAFQNNYIVSSSFPSIGSISTYNGNVYNYQYATAPIFYKYIYYINPKGQYIYGHCVYSSGTFCRSGSTSKQYYEALGIYVGATSLDQVPSEAEYIGNFSDTSSALQSLADSAPGNIVSPSEGLSFGPTFPDPDKDFENNYPVWFEGAITYPPITLPGGTEEDEAIPYVPVSIPSYSSTTPAIPPAQTVIWSGVQQDTDTEETEPSVPVVPDVGDGDITTSVSSILTVVQSILTSLVEFKDAALDWIQVAWAAFVAGLMDTLTGIKDAIIAIPGVIVGAIEALAATVTSIWEWLQEVFGLTIQKILEILTSIQAWALGLVDALILALSDLLTKIFAVDVAAVQAAVADLRAEFPFFDSIIATGEFLYNGITSGEPPVIYAYLQNAEGRYNWGTTVAVLDMSFYSRYKATGDAIMSAALYAFFGWRTFVRLPGIISGAGSDIKEVTNHYDI